jgi:hypothetical protein
MSVEFMRARSDVFEPDTVDMWEHGNGNSSDSGPVPGSTHHG